MTHHTDLLVPLEEITAFLAARNWTWEQLARGECRVGPEPISAEDIQAHLLVTDPVLWCEAFLVEKPEDGGGLWRLFDYQKPSMRYRGDVVHEDGAEVGKTREIVGLCLFSAVCEVGGQLVAGAADGNLDDIWDAIEWQLGENEWLRQQVKEITLKPYRKLVLRNGNICWFRPAGHDGRAFRGIHAARRGSFDEAPKVENPDCFSEFYRGLKPGAEARLYGVPDGRRGSPFYQLCERALPYAAAAAAAAAADQVRSPVGPPAAEPSAAGAFLPTSRRFVRFNWPKTLMPPPFWSAEREQEAIERYGGRDSSGFVRNVLGQWGDPEDTVFPWARFAPCIRHVPEYLVAKLLWDHATSTVYVDAWTLAPEYQVRAGSDVVDEDAGGPAPLHQLFREGYSFGNFDLEAVLRRLIVPPAPGVHLVAGVDVGKSPDPTELGASERRGLHHRFVLRVQLKHFGYDQQAEAIRIVDSILNPDHGWGFDSTGVGLAVEDALRGGAGGYHFDDRLTGVVFNSKTTVVDPQTGEEIPDPATGQPRRVSLKELGTQLLERAMQRGELEVPWDPDYIRYFPSHTSRKLASGERTFSGVHDHVIDQKRVEMLRCYELDAGLQTPPMTFAVPAGARRDSGELLAAYGSRGGATALGGLRDF